MTRSKFRDYRLHLEFKVPNSPDLSDKHAATAVFIIRDVTKHRGSRFVRIRKRNQYLWCNLRSSKSQCQCLSTTRRVATYDVEFIAARWDEAGKKTTNAKLTVRLNGVLIHSGTEVPGPTTAAPSLNRLSPDLSICKITVIQSFIEISGLFRSMRTSFQSVPAFSVMSRLASMVGLRFAERIRL